MAQLPPKIPTTISHNWSSPFQKLPSMPSLFFPSLNTTTTAVTNPSWVDEFLDFSTARRGAHRRSSSDSVTFLEAPAVDNVRNLDDEFDHFNDEQLMSMFSDGTPSDHNSFNKEERNMDTGGGDTRNGQAEEAQSKCKKEMENVQETELQAEAKPEQIVEGTENVMVDPKRVKRIIANRQSAQRSRVRKLQYISELERSVNTLQTEVSALSPRVAYLDHQRSVLSVGNSHLKQRIAALAQDRIFKDAHQEALKKEIERLRQVFQQQNQKKSSPSTSD